MNTFQCSGPCEQGRRECPCPQACERPPMKRSDPLLLLALFVGSWAVVSFVIKVWP